MANPSPAAVRAQLREITFLDGLTDGDYHYLSSHVDAVTYDCDDTVFQQGEARALFALIIDGAVAIEKQAGGAPQRLATFGAGQAIGEGLLLDDDRHGTTARTLQRTNALVLRTLAAAYAEAGCDRAALKVGGGIAGGGPGRRGLGGREARVG